MIMKLKGFILTAVAAVVALAACQNKETLDTSKFELSQTTLSFGTAAESKTVTLTSGKTWQAEFANGVEWVSVTPKSGSASASAQTITITVYPNDGYERSTTIKFKNGLVSQNLTVTQEGSVTREYTDISAVRILTPATSGQKITLGDNIIVKGVVVSNKNLDNFTSGKTCYIQDATGGLQIFFAATHSFEFGDKVELDLSGATLENYSQSAEISGLALAKATKIGTETVVAKKVSMADYLANKYEGQYVEINEPVQISEADLSKTWVVGEAHTSINAEDANGNTFIIRSGKFSEYGSETVAQGSGVIKGIATVYNSDIQLVFAQTTDYAGLTGARFVREVVETSAEGLVVAVSEKSYLIKTATGYSYVFVGEDGSHDLAVGDEVRVDGEEDLHNGVLQIVNPTAIKVSTGNTVTHPDPTMLDASALDAYNESDGLFGYVTITGNYSVSSGKYHNLAISGATRKGSLTYPIDVPAEYQGKNLDVTGYFVGISGSVYFNILATDINVSDVQPEIPDGISVSMIDKVENLTAGTYYMAGYLEASTGTGATTFTPYPYHVWTGTLDNSDAVTVCCSYVDGQLGVKPGSTNQITEIELVAVAGKSNTYYVKVGEKYITSSAVDTNRKLSLGTTQTEWVASNFSKGGIVLAAKELKVQWGTANAASKLLRSYKDSSADTSLKYGIVFFKQN